MGRGPERGSQSQIKEAVHGSDRKWLMAPGTAQAVQGQPQPVPPTGAGRGCEDRFFKTN